MISEENPILSIQWFALPCAAVSWVEPVGKNIYLVFRVDQCIFFYQYTIPEKELLFT